MKNIHGLLNAVAGENNLITPKVDRVAYARDLTPYFSIPDIVVFPEFAAKVLGL